MTVVNKADGSHLLPPLYADCTALLSRLLGGLKLHFH